MTRLLTLATTAVTVVTMSVACAKKDAAPADTTTTMAPGAGAPATLSVVDIDMGRHIDADKKISDKTDDFAPSDTIYASVHSSGTAANQMVVARWTFQDGQTVDEHSQTISPTGDAYTEFHIVKPSGWPKGKYTLHVLVNGNEARTKDVTVK